MSKTNIDFWSKFAWTSKHVRKDGSHEKPKTELPPFIESTPHGVIMNPWNEEKQRFDIKPLEQLLEENKNNKA